MNFKNCLTIFLSAFLCYTVSAQQLPNSSFETFETGFNSAGYQPTGWKGANVNKTVVGINVTKELVSEDANGMVGKCVRIHNESVGAAGITENSPAWIALGTPWNVLEGINTSSATAGTDGGLAFTYRPDTLNVWIKRTYNSQEDANIVVYLWSGTSVGTSYKNKGGSCTSTTHTDEESDIRQQTDRNSCTTTQYATQIGEGSWRSNQQFSTWTKVSIPITYYNNSVPEKINVILSSGNYPNFRQTTGVYAGSTLYCDELSLGYSSQLSEIRINNRAMAGFDKDTYNYTYSLGQGVTTVPTITCYRNGREITGSELTINYGAVGQPTTITVHAEDGSSTTTYTVNFVGELSTNPRPTSILLDGTAINGFNPYVYSYNVELPYGTTTCPNISVQYAESGQTSTVQCSQIPGTATVTVFAENTANSQVYTLNFTVGALTDNTLQDILLDNVSIPGFSPTKTSYVVDLPVGTTVAPLIVPVSAYAAGVQDIVVDNQGLTGTSTITVTPHGATNSRVYRITYRITASTNTSLQDIQVGGVSLPDFNSAVLNYNYSLPIGTTQLPAITWTAGDAYQTIVLETAGVEGVTKITVTSQSGAVAIYRITFATAKSSICYLTDITLDGISIAYFDSAVTTYNIELPIGTTQMPNIAWVQGDAYQTVTFTSGGLNGTSRIVVRAQDNSVVTYQLNFTVAQADNSTLLNIMLNGENLAGFSPEVTTYNYQLPRGTTQLPDITYTAHDAYQVIRVTNSGVDGETRITVRAQNGATTIYIINFSVYCSSDATLRGILVGGDTIAPFHADTLNYSIVLPSGTSSLPTIEVLPADSDQTISISRGGLNGVTTISVLAEDGTQRSYTLNFSMLKSENALLDGILLDGVALPGFDPNTFEYTYQLDDAATTAPVISVQKDESQSVLISTPRLTGTASIEVTPEEGAKNVYIIHFVMGTSSNCALNGITVGGEAITNFHADTLNYVVTLPQGTTSMPAVGFVAGDTLQQVHQYNGTLNSPTQIVVVAQDGTSRTYSVVFQVVRSSDATLQSISVGGVLLDGFDAQQTHYTYTLAPNSSALPEINYVKQNSAQRVEAVLPALNGTASLQVTSEDGTASMVYEIEFSFAPFTNTALSGITLDGVVLSTFDPDVTEYTISLEYDQTTPVVGYIAADSTQHIAIAQAGSMGTQIVVVSQSGDSRTYQVDYTRQPGSDATLSGIQLYDGRQWRTLPNFSSEVSLYVDSLAWHTASVPVINPLSAQSGQHIQILYGAVNDTTTINITAQDGSTTAQYKLYFPVIKSSESHLSGLTIGGVSVVDFDPNQSDYTISLPYQTSMVPDITWDLAIDESGEPIAEQQVELTMRSLSEASTLKVTAEDGTETTYTLHFEVAKSTQENLLSMILVDGVALENYAPTTYAYQVTLAKGTTTMPTISYVKSYPEQSVVVNKGTVSSPTTIAVYSDVAGAAPTVYTINAEVSTVSSAYLTSISIDGTPLEGFSSTVLSYIVPVTSNPTVTYTTPSGVSYEEKISNTKQKQISAFSLNNDDETTYNLYFYYTGDVIPNGNFESWETANYNSADRPTGWTVPADIVEKYLYTSFSIFVSEANRTYRTGEEVKRQTADDGNNYVRLHTWSQQFSTHGGVPGMMTLGDMSLNLTNSGGSTSGVSGGITFRNTPDEAHMDYMQASANTRIDNMRFVFNLSDGSATEELVYTDNSFNNTWKHMSFPVATSVSAPTQMNLIVNAVHSENASDLGACAVCTDWNHEGTMYVDNLYFYYNNKLSNLTVDGVAISGFDANVYSYDLTLPAEYVGVPELVATGEVSDQAYRYIWSGWNNGAASMTVAVTAEDGSVQNYVVNFTKPLSTISTLSSISLDDVQLPGFDANTTNYTYDVNYHYTSYPDVYTVAGSAHQTITTTYSGDQIVMVVTAESGAATTYTVNLNRVPTTGTDLWALSLSNGALTFNADQTLYQVTLGSTEVLPTILFTKSIDGQTVRVHHGMQSVVTVTSEDGLNEKEYQINFTRSAIVTDATLQGIYLDGQLLTDFSAAGGTYRYTVTGDEALQSHFVKSFDQDAVSQVITEDSILWTVTGDVATNYLLYLDRPVANSNALATISYRGTELAEFNATDYLYQIVKPATETILLEAVTSTQGQNLTVTYAPTDSIMAFDYEATAADSSARQTTRVEFTKQLSSNRNLADILINGESLVALHADYTSDYAFSATQYNYNVTLKVDEPKSALPVVPAISATAAEVGQQITIENNGLNNDAVITVTAEDGGEQLYIVHLDVESSGYALLSALSVNATPIAEFQPQVYSYHVTLTEREIPTVAYYTDDAYQTISAQTTADSAVIVVTAENGVNTQRYTVYFDYDLSSNSSLETILIDGTPMSGFDADTLNYTITLPIGTTQLPTISVVSGDDYQDVTITTGGVNGTTTIEVTAQDGTTTTYTIDFNVLLSTESRLQMILLNNMNLETGNSRFTVDQNFDADILNYQVTLPVGTRVYPTLSWLAGDEYQSISMTQEANGIYRIDVVAQDTNYKSSYRVTYTILRSQNCQLGAILLNDEILSTTSLGYTADADFESTRYTYHVQWPIGSITLPRVTWATGDTLQQVTLTNATTLNDSIVLVVTAEDAAYSSRYVIYNELLLSENSLLNDLAVGGTTVSGFRSDSLEYWVLLPVGTTTLPEITWVNGDVYQTVTSVGGGVNGTTIVTVTAQDETYVTRYIIHFEVEKSHNAFLTALTADNVLVPGFDMELFHYHLYLPYGTTVPPVLGYTAAEPMVQNVMIEQPATLTDTGYVTVTAHDGVTINRYRVTFELLLSDNALLDSIYLDGVFLSTGATTFKADQTFESELFNYHVTLPNGTTTLPEITWVGEVADYDTITIEYGGLTGVTVITVTSQDGTEQNSYNITFDVAKSTYAQLADLRLYGETIEGFDPSTYEYYIEFPVGTDTTDLPTIEDVTYLIGHPGETVSYSQVEPTIIAVIVTAEDGVTFNVYVINFEILLNNNCLLKDLKVDGLSLIDFQPEQFDYEYLLFPGAQVPEIEPIKGDESQEVYISKGAVGELTYIYVEAEDGSESTYTIYFANSTDNPGDKPKSEDVCWTPLGNGNFKASTRRNNVSVIIYDTHGRLLERRTLPLVDPNFDICDPSAQGEIFTYERSGKVYIYVFIYDKGDLIDSGKFLY